MSDSKSRLIRASRLNVRTLQLPSKGLFYEQGVLAETVSEGVLKIFPLTNAANMSIRNSDLLFSGETIHTICEYSIPEILKPAELLQKDVEAIMVYLKLVSEGKDYEIGFSHRCKIKNKKENKIDEVVTENSSIVDLESLTSSKITFLEDISAYSIKLSNGIIVKARPQKYMEAIQTIHFMETMIRECQSKFLKEAKKDSAYVDMNDEKILQQFQFSNSDLFKVQQRVLNDMKNCVIKIIVPPDEQEPSVSEFTELEDIAYWWDLTPPKIIKEFIDALNACNGSFGIDLMVDVECKKCKEKVQLPLPTNPVDFFTDW